MRFLSNTYDPTTEGAKESFFGGIKDPQSRNEAWANYLEWVDAHVIGEPQATRTYTVEELKKMGMVGVYAEDEEISEIESEARR
jgi:hypothetical protein